MNSLLTLLRSKLFVLAILTTLFAGRYSVAATSVSQFGITWTFDADYPVGQYVNGDYYVVAPSGVRITSISPKSTYTPTRQSIVVITVGNPATIAWPAHGLKAGAVVRFTTTGTLPANLDADKPYFVLSSGLTTDTFRVSDSPNGTAISLSTVGIGVHTADIGRVMHGSMVNPTARTFAPLGFDSTLNNSYDPRLNAGRPNGRD